MFPGTIKELEPEITTVPKTQLAVLWSAVGGRPAEDQELQPRHLMFFWTAELIAQAGPVKPEQQLVALTGLAHHIMNTGETLSRLVSQGSKQVPAVTLGFFDRKLACMEDTIIHVETGEPAQFKEMPLEGINYNLTKLFVMNRKNREHGSGTLPPEDSAGESGSEGAPAG